jgi:hypothetical protein
MRKKMFANVFCEFFFEKITFKPPKLPTVLEVAPKLSKSFKRTTFVEICL